MRKKKSTFNSEEETKTINSKDENRDSKSASPQNEKVVCVGNENVQETRLRYKNFFLLPIVCFTL